MAHVSRKPLKTNSSVTAQTDRAMDVLTIEHVSRNFGGIRALDDVSLHAGAGEILAIIGPNGAGKTTLINGISGRHHPDSGRILVENPNITRLEPRKIG